MGLYAVEPDVPDVIVGGRYRLMSALGDRGPGPLVLAEQINLSRPVTIQFLAEGSSAAADRRFMELATVLASFRHRHCARVTDVGRTEAGVPYAVMPVESVDPLTDLLDRPIDAHRAARLAVAILQGLEHAHEHGLVHRALEPSCISVAREDVGTLHVSGFWTGLILGEHSAGVSLSELEIGDVHYQSPEQVTGQDVDPRADLYAVGVILFQMLVGHTPFTADDPVKVLEMHIGAPFPELPLATPPPLAAIVGRLTARSPEDRYQRAAEAISDLEDFVQGRAGRAGWVASASSGASSRGPIGATSVRDGTGESTRRGTGVIPSPASSGPERGLYARLLWVLLAVAVLVGLGWWWWRGRPSDAPAVEPPPAGSPSLVSAAASPPAELMGASESPPSLGTTMRMLAVVNEGDVERAASYPERHALLERLAERGHSDKVDERLQVALDLLQAEQAPSPCRTFERALEQIGARDDPYFAPTLASAVVPTGSTAGGPGDARCDGLTARLHALRSRTEGSRPADGAASSRGPRGPASKRRRRSSRTASSGAAAPAAPATTSDDRPPAADEPEAKRRPKVHKIDQGVYKFD